MKFFGILLCTILCFGSSLRAQNIQGTVKQPDGQPAAYSTVTLRAVADSVLVKGALTGDDGAYSIGNVAKGRYFIRVELLGFVSAFSEAFDYNGDTYQVPVIALKEQTTDLKTVNIVARKPTIEVKADKTILNVEGTVNSTGLNALELLRKAPGVTVDNNENVNVKGKNNVRIQIDGRDTPLDGQDLAAYLKGTQAADIANIEIISNPSAKYDASGNAGIINIRLKKNKSFGTNGNVGIEGVYGESLKGGVNLSLNNRTKKFNTFGSYNNHYGTWHNTNDFGREQVGQYFNQQSLQENDRKWNSARVGSDYAINSKHTVGILLNGSHDDSDNFSNSTTDIGSLSSRERVDSILVASNTVLGRNINLNVNLNYRFADTSGHSLNIDVDRGMYQIRSSSFQPNFYRSANNSELLNERIFRNNTPTDIHITTIKSDYEQTLWKGALGIGFKIADVETDNTFDFFNVKEGVSQIDTNVSNRFIYKERTSAGYVNYNRKFGKNLNIQTGLRLEHTMFTGDLIAYSQQNNQDPVENTYTKLFPSAAVTYTFTPKIGLNATYSRRIDRPSYQDLNPFEFKLDELTFQRGNPRLRPQFTNAFELSPTYQGYPIVTLSYSRTNDVFTQVLATDTENTRATFITQENIADQQNYSASLNIPTPFAKWYEGFISLTVYHSKFSAKFDNLGFNIDQIAFTSGNLYAEQTVKLPRDWSVQLSGWYSLRGYWGTLQSNAQGVMDLGIQKKIMDGKGQLRLRFGDLLGTARWSGQNVLTPGLRMSAAGTWEARTVTVNFSYRFGSNEVKAQRQRKTGIEEESKRVKSGG